MPATTTSVTALPVAWRKSRRMRDQIAGEGAHERPPPCAVGLGGRVGGALRHGERLARAVMEVRHHRGDRPVVATSDTIQQTRSANFAGSTKSRSVHAREGGDERPDAPSHERGVGPLEPGGAITGGGALRGRGDERPEAPLEGAGGIGGDGVLGHHEVRRGEAAVEEGVYGHEPATHAEPD